MLDIFINNSNSMRIDNDIIINILSIGAEILIMILPSMLILYIISITSRAVKNRIKQFQYSRIQTESLELFFGENGKIIEKESERHG